MRLFFTIALILLTLQQFWYLSGLLESTKESSFHVHIAKLPLPQESNRSVAHFFDPKIWQQTQADRIRTVKKKDVNLTKKPAYDENTTVELVMKKGSKMLCRGKECMTIRGIISQMLLLQKGKGKIISIKPSDTIFDNVKLEKISDTKLLFVNTKNGEKYSLAFFAYRQKRENNETNRSHNRIQVKKDKK